MLPYIAAPWILWVLDVPCLLLVHGLSDLDGRGETLPKESKGPVLSGAVTIPEVMRFMIR